jgi:hypothetical protein
MNKVSLKAGESETKLLYCIDSSIKEHDFASRVVISVD